MRKKVAIIDDNKDFLQQIMETMELSGYEAIGFSKSSTALQKIPDLKPDVILLDLRLNGENGVDVTRKLKENPATKEIPIICMTAYYDEETHSHLQDAYGVKVCLRKPLRPLDVISQVEYHFKRNNNHNSNNKS